MTMVNKIEHHVFDQAQIDRLSNITEKSIFLALEEKELTNKVDFDFHQKINNVLFNKGKKHDVDLVMTSRTGDKLYVEIKGQMTYFEVNKLKYLLGLRRNFYIMQLTEIDWITPFEQTHYHSKFQKSKHDFEVQIDELVDFVKGEVSGNELKSRSIERLNNFIEYRSHDVDRWKQS